MKLMGIFIAAIVLSTNANANLEVTADTITIYDGYEFINKGAIDFENVCMDELPIFPDTNYRIIDVSITNNTASTTLTEFTVSLSGNSNEICFYGPCPPVVNLECPTTLYPMDSCDFKIMMEPDHFGKKKKKLNIDAVNNGNDISLTIPITGTSYNPQSAQDIPCYQLPTTTP